MTGHWITFKNQWTLVKEHQMNRLISYTQK